MRKLITLLTISLLILSCQDKKKPSSNNQPDIFKESFSNYKELAVFEDYDKISDTSYVKNGFEPTHRITHINRDNEHILLFNKITLDESNQENYLILDSLIVKNLEKGSYISVGYCETKNSLSEEIIAILRRTNKDTIQEILKAWKANSESQKIEEIKNLKKITCLNEY